VGVYGRIVIILDDNVGKDTFGCGNKIFLVGFGTIITTIDVLSETGDDPSSSIINSSSILDDDQKWWSNSKIYEQ